MPLSTATIAPDVAAQVASKTVQPADRTIVLGRGENCDVVVARDGVSRDHARLQLRQGQWTVSDLASTNGTWLDDTRVRSPVPIEPGQVLRLGRWVVELELERWAADTVSSEPRASYQEFQGFISYKHGAGDELAEALEAHLSLFGRDLFEQRELSLFLDKGQLTASSNLWERLVDALERSEHLVVMACPAWAQSRWCRVEVEWWLANRGVRDLIIVQTGGEIFWGNGDFDWSRTTALPKSMRGYFKAEPLWVDARHIEHRSLKNPAFLQLVTRLSAALHRTTLDDVTRRYRRRQVQLRALLGVGCMGFTGLCACTLVALGIFLRLEPSDVVEMSGILARAAVFPTFFQ